MRDPEHFRFFADHVSTGRLHINSEEYHHAVNVLRLEKNQPFWATDGKGNVYRCRSLQPDTDGASACIVSRSIQPPPFPRITLYVGLPSRESFEKTLEMAVPFGVERIIPLLCRTCQGNWWKSRWEKLSQRFTRKMTEAMKQSLSGFLPVLERPVSLAAALPPVQEFHVVADSSGPPLLEQLSKSRPREAACIIGPPGGFTDHERGHLQSHGTLPVSLAHTRLRTELAAVSLCAVLSQYSLREYNRQYPHC